MAYLMLDVPTDRTRRDDGTDDTQQSELDARLADDLASRAGRVGGTLLLAHESAANDALTRYRLAALKALTDYSGLRGKDAVDGHDGYRQTLQSGRDGVLGDVPQTARVLLQPHLDRLHNERLHWGMAHRAEQDKQWANRSAIEALEADRQEAALRPDDLNLLQRLAKRSDQTWSWIGQREGWSDEVVLQHAQRAKSELFGRVMATQMDKGDAAGVERTWQFAQNHVDPQTMTDVAPNAPPPEQEQPHRDAEKEQNGSVGTVLSNRVDDSSIPEPKWVSKGGSALDYFIPGGLLVRQYLADKTDRPTARTKKYVPHPYHLVPESVGDQEIDLDELYADVEFDPDGSGREWTGIKMLPFDSPHAALFLKGFVEDTTRKLQRDGRLPPGWVDDEVDAFRHAYGAYEATRNYGPYVAKAFGDANEVSGDADGNSKGGSAMDLYNNRIGRILARDPANADRDPVEVILEALRKGLLRTSPFKIKQP